MILREWEIWRTFPTYFVDLIVDLDAATQEMVRSGLVSCAVLRDGKFWWKEEDVARSGTVTLTLHPDDMA